MQNIRSVLHPEILPHQAHMLDELDAQEYMFHIHVDTVRDTDLNIQQQFTSMPTTPR